MGLSYHILRDLELRLILHEKGAGLTQGLDSFHGNLFCLFNLNTWFSVLIIFYLERAALLACSYSAILASLASFSSPAASLAYTWAYSKSFFSKSDSVASLPWVMASLLAIVADLSW